MKVKNIAFSGFMAAILMGAVATPADAVSVASKEYVDARETAINTNLTQTYLTKTDAGNTYVTKTDAEAFQKSEDALTDQDVADAITGAVTNNEALAGALADKEDTANKVGAITKEQLDGMTATDKANKYASIEAAEDIAEISAAKINEVGGEVLQLSNQVSANKTAIETLNGGADETGSVANTIAQALNDGGQIDVALDGKQDKLSQDQINAIAQVATNTANIATNTANIAKKADAATTLAGYGITDAYTATQTDNLLGGKVNATGQTANQIMVTDAEGKVVTVAKISSTQVDALNKLATASLPEVCTNNDGTLCALTVDKQGNYAWTVIVEQPTSNP